MLAGYGSSLELLAVAGYIALMGGTYLLWSNRGEMREWLRLESRHLRAELFRRDVPTKWSTLRENDGLIFAAPSAGRVGNYSGSSPRPLHYGQIVFGAGLLLAGQLLILLAFIR
jgi:hypothetical protein